MVFSFDFGTNVTKQKYIITKLIVTLRYQKLNHCVKTVDNVSYLDSYPNLELLKKVTTKLVLTFWSPVNITNYRSIIITKIMVTLRYQKLNHCVKTVDSVSYLDTFSVTEEQLLFSLTTTRDSWQKVKQKPDQ